MTRAGKVLLILVAAAMVATAALSGCGAKQLTITKGTLTMGSDTAYPPFEEMKGNTPEGFDVDVATEIAKRMGLELKVIPTAWDGIIPGLKTEKYDVIMSAMTITPERSKEINFSNPYINSDQSIAVRKGSPIKGEADLAGKTVGVQIDTTGQMKAEEWQKAGKLKEIQKFDTILMAFQALEQEKVEAVINDYPVNLFISKTRGKTEVAAKVKTDEKYGIGVKKGNDDLLKEINSNLADIKSDGTYDKIYKKWFGVGSTT